MSTPLPSVPHPLFRNIEFAAFAMLVARSISSAEDIAPSVVERWKRHAKHIMENGPGMKWPGRLDADSDWEALLKDGVRWISTTSTAPLLLVLDDMEWSRGPVMHRKPCFTEKQAATLLEKIESLHESHPHVYFDFQYDRECQYYVLPAIYAASAPFAPFGFQGLSDGQTCVRVGMHPWQVVRFLITYGLVAPEFRHGDLLIVRYPRAVHEALLTLVEAGRKPCRVRGATPALKLTSLRGTRNVPTYEAYDKRPLRLRPIDFQLESLAKAIDMENRENWNRWSPDTLCLENPSRSGEKRDWDLVYGEDGMSQWLMLDGLNDHCDDWLTPRADCAATATNPERLFTDIRLCPSCVLGK